MRFPLSQAAGMATYIAKNKMRPRPEWQKNVAVADDSNPFRIIHTQIPAVGQERKPHPMPLLHAAATMGVDPAHCVYVGDAERDMQAAQAAGMYALVAGYGYLGDNDRADVWFSHGWLDTPLELIEWLDKPRNGSV